MNTACINTCTQFTKCTHTHTHTRTVPLLAVSGVAAAEAVEDTELVTGEPGVA